MKKTICIFGALLLSLCILTSCSGGGGGGAFSGITNTFSGICHCWVNGDEGMRFDNNGKCYGLVKVKDTWYEVSDSNISYTIDGSNITLKDSGGKTEKATFSISNGKLTLKYEGGGEETLTKTSISPTSKTKAEIVALMAP